MTPDDAMRRASLLRMRGLDVPGRRGYSDTEQVLLELQAEVLRLRKALGLLSSERESTLELEAQNARAGQRNREAENGVLRDKLSRVASSLEAIWGKSQDDQTVVRDAFIMQDCVETVRKAMRGDE